MSARTRRIAIVCADRAGRDPAPGIGSSERNLALVLAQAGHAVTVVCVHGERAASQPAGYNEYFALHGIQPIDLASGEKGVSRQARKEMSLQCYWWLRDQAPFDVIHFQESHGLAYYSAMAKKAGLAFSSTLLCVNVRGPARWRREGDEVLISSYSEVVTDFMERHSTALADALVSSSQYLLEWMRNEGWTLPPHCSVAGEIAEPLQDPLPQQARNVPVREVVFFGPLSVRKGVPFFCDVLDRMAAGGEPRFAVTFLGQDATIAGRISSDYVRQRSARWNIIPTLLTTLNRAEALAYLAEPGRLAVTPSVLDDAPKTVCECLHQGIPLLASDRGGIPDLIHPEDRERVTGPLFARGFAERLRIILKSGQLPARPAAPRDAAREAWLRWHESLPPAPEVQPALARKEPLISVCIAHYERPQLLEKMLESLRRQSYSHFEVVLVDDGSATAEANRYLDSLAEDFKARGWQLHRQENAGPGMARDLAVREAQGSYLLFADDDDVLPAHAVETFAHAAIHTGADALSCILAEFAGSDPPADVKRAHFSIPLGPALAPGLMFPEFGGTLYMLTRECYTGVGGFSPVRDLDEDWEILLSVVAKGFDLQLIPEPLVFYRQHGGTRSSADNKFLRHRSRVSAYERLLPPELRDFAALAFARLSNITDSASQRRLERLITSVENARRQNLPRARVEAPMDHN